MQCKNNCKQNQRNQTIGPSQAAEQLSNVSEPSGLGKYKKLDEVGKLNKEVTYGLAELATLARWAHRVSWLAKVAEFVMLASQICFPILFVQPVQPLTSVVPSIIERTPQNLKFTRAFSQVFLSTYKIKKWWHSFWFMHLSLSSNLHDKHEATSIERSMCVSSSWVSWLSMLSHVSSGNHCRSDPVQVQSTRNVEETTCWC